MCIISPHWHSDVLQCLFIFSRLLILRCWYWRYRIVVRGQCAWHCDNVRHSHHTDHYWRPHQVRGHWGTLGTGQTRPGDITACILILIQGPTPPHQHKVVPINIHINTYVISTHIHQYINTEQMTKKAIVHPDVFISFDVQCFNGILLVILLLHIHCVNHMILSLTMKLRNSE